MSQYEDVRAAFNPMQKAVIIQHTPNNSGVYGRLPTLDATALNSHLAAGWRFITAVPFGVSVSCCGDGNGDSAFAAILVIIEKPK